MEHIVQLGVNIDDEAIKNAVVNESSKQITKEIGESMQEAFFKKYRCCGDRTDLTNQTIKIVKDWLNENKEEIIENVVVEISEYLKRTKAVKEAVAKVVEND